MNDQDYGQVQETIGERIVYFRKQAGLTQAQLAEKLNISAQAVSKWEADLSCPDIMSLVPLAKIFSISTDVLLGAEQIPKKKEEAGESSIEETKAQTSFDIPGELMVVEEEISGIHFQLGAVEAVIMEGEKYSVEWLGMPKDSFESQVKNGVWKIKTNNFLDPIQTIKSIFDNKKMKITIPVGSNFQDIKINLGAGSLEGFGLRGDKAFIEVGAGQMKLHNLISTQAKISCGMGSVGMSGDIKESCKVECGMGDVNIILKKPEDYGYKVSLGMGQVTVGENKISGTGEQKVNGKASILYDISCGMGMAALKFREPSK